MAKKDAFFELEQIMREMPASDSGSPQLGPEESDALLNLTVDEALQLLSDLDPNTVALLMGQPIRLTQLTALLLAFSHQASAPGSNMTVGAALALLGRAADAIKT